MKVVFVVDHAYTVEPCGHDEAKRIGVFASEDEANAAVERARSLPGFRESPDGFSISRIEVGRQHWTEGFVRLSHVLMPSEVDPSGYEVVAVREEGGLWRIDAIDSGATRPFAVGDLVRCEEREIEGHGRVLVVVERARGVAE